MLKFTAPPRILRSRSVVGVSFFALRVEAVSYLTDIVFQKFFGTRLEHFLEQPKSIDRVMFPSTLFQCSIIFLNTKNIKKYIHTGIISAYDFIESFGTLEHKTDPSLSEGCNTGGTSALCAKV